MFVSFIKSLLQAAKSLPKQHLIGVAILSMTLIGCSIFFPSSSTEPKRTQIPLELELSSQTIPKAPEPVEDKTPSLPWQKLTVKSGDSLSTLFKRASLPASQLLAFINSDKEKTKPLTLLRPGQSIEIQTESNALQALRYKPSKLKTITFTKSADGFEREEQSKEPTVKVRFVAATLDSSLFLDGRKAGLPQNLIMEMAGIFSGVMDFVFDPRKGDTFSILFEEKFLGDERLGYGNILMASYNNKGEEHKAYRYTDANGKSGFYSEKGVSMTKAFMRAPLDFTRITSNFNPRRLHPITKKVKAHRGVDYAASVGTPVYSAGDGRVIASGYNKFNGNYVIIKHGVKYQTKYLHLHKRFVKKGQKVRQKQTIGTVGTTGMSSGPHLHYEFLVNGVHRNPRTIYKQLPKAKAIAKNERSAFEAQIHPLKLQANKYQHDFEIAKIEP